MDDSTAYEKQPQNPAPVQLYSIGPQEAGLAKPLLTAEAAALIENDQAFGIAIAEDGKARGALCARLAPDNDICLELLSLYVVLQYRRRRLGTTLLSELFELCGEIFDGTIQRIETTFLSEPGLMALLQKAGFKLEADETGICSYLIPVSGLADCPFMKKNAPRPGNCTLVPFEKLSHIHIRRLFQALREADADYMEPGQLYQALPGASFVLLDAAERPVACAVFTGDGEQLCLSQFFAAGGNAINAVAVFQAAARALIGQYPGADLELPLLVPSSAGLAKRLLGDAVTPRPLIRAVLEL